MKRAFPFELNDIANSVRCTGIYSAPLKLRAPAIMIGQKSISSRVIEAYQQIGEDIEVL